jgi:hypothetical protein
VYGSWLGRPWDISRPEDLDQLLELPSDAPARDDATSGGEEGLARLQEVLFPTSTHLGPGAGALSLGAK